MKILVATCGSAQSDLAVRSAAIVARAVSGQMTILTVIKESNKQADGQAILDQAILLAQGVHDVDGRIRLGRPAEEIVHEAQEGLYDLVVVGTWPKHNLLHRLLAPTTERVVMQARCPVLVAKGELRHLHHILICASGANSPSQPARFVADLVHHYQNNLQITVLHVMSQVSAGPAVNDGWQLHATAQQHIRQQTPEGQWLQSEVQVLDKPHVTVKPMVRHGLVVDEVLLEAASGNCDLLVMGAHRQAGWERYLLDDLSHQILVRADRPVLVVRSQ